MAKHESIALEDAPIEFIQVTSINPFLDECLIKVCYVDDEKANRNRTIISKELGRSLAGTLPGSPIVGHYNEVEQDFEEHNQIFEIKNGQIYMSENTRPYGFVPTDAKVWFQKFIDDDEVEREYLCTTGYLWTGQYPEAKRVIQFGNNQSMKLNSESVKGTWTKSKNGSEKFFIINEAIIENLCILGEDVEPCFEGSQITSYSFNPQFTQSFYSMMEEMQKMIKGGPMPMFVSYAVDIGDSLWCAIYDYLWDKGLGDKYCVFGLYEEGEQKFAVLRNRTSLELVRLNFSLTEENGFVPDDELQPVSISFDPMFDQAAVDAFETTFKASKEEAKKSAEPEEKPGENYSEEKCPECGKPLSECTCDKGKEEEEEEGKNKYSAIEEELAAAKADVEALTAKYSALEDEKKGLEKTVQTLTEENASLKKDNESLTTFKLEVEKSQKQAMIDKFTMLSDTDKIDVIENIDKYSLEDIEAKLSIICVRNRVRFDDDSDNKGEAGITTYSFSNNQESTNTAPDWLKSVKNVADELKI